MKRAAFLKGAAVAAVGIKVSNVHAQEATPPSVDLEGYTSPPTIFVDEVKSWCWENNGLEYMEYTFLPGSDLYLDRVRLEPVSDKVLGEGTKSSVNFRVPPDIEVTYLNVRGGEPAVLLADFTAAEPRWIEVVEAHFTRMPAPK